MAHEITPRVRAGAKLSAKLWNRLCDAVDRCRILDNAGGGLDIRRGPEGTTLTVAGEESPVPAQAPSGGVPAKVSGTPGSAVCTLFTWDGTSHVLGSDTATVLNDHPAAVGANKLIKIYRWSGAWWILTEAC